MNYFIWVFLFINDPTLSNPGWQKINTPLNSIEECDTVKGRLQTIGSVEDKFQCLPEDETPK